MEGPLWVRQTRPGRARRTGSIRSQRRRSQVRHFNDRDPVVVRLLRGASGRLLGPSFERLWLGSVFASSGDGLALGAVPLLAVAVDPRPFAVSLVVAADSLPWLLMALPAGEFADRFERGPLIALMNCLRAAVILVAVLLILTDQMTIALLIVIALANSAGRAVYYSSMQAMAVALVEPDALSAPTES